MGMTAKPTASALGIAMKCAHAWAPGVMRIESSSEEARLGSAFHEIVATVINGCVPATAPLAITTVAQNYRLGREQAEVLERMVAGWRAWWETSPLHQPGGAEIAYAYDPTTDTARILPQSTTHRDYSQAKPDEFCGTADVVNEINHAWVVVTDHKCGQRRYVPVPKHNRQLRFLALCAARVAGVSQAEVHLDFIDAEGGVVVESADFDAFDLAAIAGEMTALAANLAGAPQPQPGPHCEWCPAVGACPEAQQTMLELAPVPPPAPFQMVARTQDIQSADHATWLLQRYRMAQAALEFVKEALHGYADAHGGIATGDGATWRRKEVPVEHITLTPAAKAALEVELPGAVKDVVTKTSIKDAARVAKRKLKATEDAVMALLRSYGVVTTSTTVRYEDK